jgi:hypothetical protein
VLKYIKFIQIKYYPDNLRVFLSMFRFKHFGVDMLRAMYN